MKYETIVCPFCENRHAHITYEENRMYRLNCLNCRNAILHQDTSWDNAVNFFKRVVVTDEAALRAQQERESPKPLPLDDLRQMDGEPAWFVSLHDGFASWGIVRVVEMSKVWFIAVAGAERAFGDLDGYGKTWIAYRHKPEEETR